MWLVVCALQFQEVKQSSSTVSSFSLLFYYSTLISPIKAPFTSLTPRNQLMDTTFAHTPTTRATFAVPGLYVQYVVPDPK